MNNVLIDSSIWILYFRGFEKKIYSSVDNLINNNQLCTNDLILSELLPFLIFKKQNEVAQLLKAIKNISINVEWKEIIKMQLNNLRNGINNVGIPDLIILQNVFQNDLILYSDDKHFRLMSRHYKIRMI